MQKRPTKRNVTLSLRKACFRAAFGPKKKVFRLQEQTPVFVFGFSGKITLGVQEVLDITIKTWLRKT